MYLNASTDKLEIVLTGTVATNQLEWNVSYQDIVATGMTLPQSASAGLTNDTTAVDMVAAPAASTTRQVTHITLFNADTIAAEVTISKDVSATPYTIVKSLLQAGDTLQWSREAGWTVLKRSDQESIILTEFTANGTWTKPMGLKRVLVCCVGAGGGGGSGRRDAAGTNRSGGGGGGGGAVVWRNVAATDLTSTVSVTIGAIGTGGAGQTVNTTNGNAAIAGGDTSFGALVIAKGGSGGSGGGATSGLAGSGGNNQFCQPSFGPYGLSGSSGSNGNNGNSSSATFSFITTGGCGGGGGGGISSANASSTAGGTGGGIYQNGVFIAGPTSGASPNGANNQSNFLLFSSTLSSSNGLGTGGAGGYHTSYPTFINGGNGGNFGAGGGGGSASVNGNISGGGGNGAGGLCVVMEIY
jgi:hypothetical protein